MNTIGETIKKLRKAKGMTQEELAEVIHVSYQAVSKWENGGSPDLEMLPVLANTFGVTIDELFSVGDHVEARDISFSADSRLFAVAGAAGHVAVYELATGRMVFSFTDTYLARSLSEIRFNANGNYIMVADFNRTRFRVYSTTNGQTVYNMNATKEIRDWGFDLETGDAVMCYTDGSAQIFRMFEDEDSLVAYARERTAK